MAQLKITWTKSCIGRPQNQRKVIDSLGLKRLHHTVTHGDTPTIRGMVNKVQHLLSVEEIAEAE
jgi:large subunit ribosomal protein L30